MPQPTLVEARLLDAMLRVRDLERALEFYVGQLGMRVLRAWTPQRGASRSPSSATEGQRSSVIALTHNWGTTSTSRARRSGTWRSASATVYDAIAAPAQAGVKVVRSAGLLKRDSREVIAFELDPDGYRIELIQREPL